MQNRKTSKGQSLRSNLNPSCIVGNDPRKVPLPESPLHQDRRAQTQNKYARLPCEKPLQTKTKFIRMPDLLALASSHYDHVVWKGEVCRAMWRGSHLSRPPQACFAAIVALNTTPTFPGATFTISNIDLLLALGSISSRPQKNSSPLPDHCKTDVANHRRYTNYLR